MIGTNNMNEYKIEVASINVRTYEEFYPLYTINARSFEDACELAKDLFTLEYKDFWLVSCN